MTAAKDAAGQPGPGHRQGRHDVPARAAPALAPALAAALAAHAADRSAPLAEFGCGTGRGGAALARAGFTRIDGFDASDDELAAAARRDVYRRLRRAGSALTEGIGPGVYANAAITHTLDPERVSPQVLDDVLALLPPGGCLAFSLPGGGASLGRFRSRVLELCEHFVAEPVFRGHAPPPSAREPQAGLQSTVYVLKKR